MVVEVILFGGSIGVLVVGFDCERVLFIVYSIGLVVCYDDCGLVVLKLVIDSVIRCW